MPAETIYGRDGVDVRVSWGDAEMETVQIVTQVAKRDGVDDPTERLFGIINDWLTAAGEPPLDLAKLKAALPYTPFFDGWWVELGSWGTVNKLIKTLQRARDRSYGPPA